MTSNIAPMLQQFHRFYPQGSLISELVNIDRGLYIVKVSVQQQNIILGTALAAADTVEKAEDKARERAIATLNYSLPVAETAPQSVATPPEKTKTPPPAEVSPLYSIPEPAPEPVIEQAIEPVIELAPEPTIEPISEPAKEFAAVAAPSATTQTNIFEQPLTPPVEETPTNIFEQPLATEESLETAVSIAPEPESEPPINTVEFDFNEIKHRIDLEMKRLNWTKEQGRDYLLSTYGKRSRLHLTDNELLEFLGYVENLPG